MDLDQLAVTIDPDQARVAADVDCGADVLGRDGVEGALEVDGVIGVDGALGPGGAQGWTRGVGERFSESALQLAGTFWEITLLTGKENIMATVEPGPRPNLNVPSLSDRIRQDLEKKVRERLGLSAKEPLPPDVGMLVTNTSQTAASKAIELGVTSDAEALARDAARGVLFESFGEKVSAARTGIDFIAGSNDVSAILTRRAQLLWAKRKALETAGFSNAEAMQILLADIGARSQQ
jgi:hypothetical protein